MNEPKPKRGRLSFRIREEDIMSEKQNKQGTLHAASGAVVVSILVAGMAGSSAFAQEEEKSPWRFNGVIRGNYQYLDYVSSRKGVLEFDTLFGKLAYDDGSVIGSGQIRYYRYSHRQTGGTDSGEMVFLQHLWVGYRFNDQSELNAGLSSQPFGLYPYAGNNLSESMAYWAGYEDTQSFGIKYSRRDGELETQLAIYPSDGGYGWASASGGNFLEKESARYSYHAVNGNLESNTVVARVAYGIQHGQDEKSEIGLSYLNGRIDSTINQAGNRDAMAVHYAGSFGKLGVRLQAMQYDYRLNGSPTTLSIGSYGYSNKLATKGNIYIANVSYALDGSIGPFSGFTAYNDYSVLSKSAAGFVDSSQNVAGVSADAGKWRGYVDYMHGKNSTFMSPVGYNGLGSGAATNNMGKRININVGYYF